jgi:N-acetylglucosaminyl-diphospho-decaprenol L-rhamnosyltransferase
VLVDAVVVSYNSGATLRRCVAPLAAREEVRVIVVDNASADGSLAALADLAVDAVALGRNIGFARACNVGWRSGDASYVLFLNPDATIAWDAVLTLVRTLEDDPSVGVVGPRLEHLDGSLQHSQHPFPRLSTTYGQALFLHHLGLDVVDDLRDPQAYDEPGSPDWLSGTCLLLRRRVLEDLGGFDERFFLYREDVDLCRRLRDRGLDVRFEPRAFALHEGGGSSTPDVTLPLYTASRVLYAHKYRGRAGALLERLGLALRALTHVVVTRDGRRGRLGHARSVVAALKPR